MLYIIQSVELSGDIMAINFTVVYIHLLLNDPFKPIF